jgi:hypothetical protein
MAVMMLLKSIAGRSSFRAVFRLLKAENGRQKAEILNQTL